MTMSLSGSKNPLEDEEVKALLDSASSTIGNKHDFSKWQKSFLDRFATFLDSKGSDKAQKAYETFSKSSDGLIRIVKQLQKLIEKGDLGPAKTTVKARTATSQLKATLTKLGEELAKLMPTTGPEIKRFGFTKYHMGAVLVNDGFKEYAVMQYCRALLILLRVAALDASADRQVLQEIESFGKQVRIMREVYSVAFPSSSLALSQIYFLVHSDYLLTHDRLSPTQRTSSTCSAA